MPKSPIAAAAASLVLAVSVTPAIAEDATGNAPAARSPAVVLGSTQNDVRKILDDPQAGESVSPLPASIGRKLGISNKYAPRYTLTISFDGQSERAVMASLECDLAWDTQYRIDGAMVQKFLAFAGGVGSWRPETLQTQSQSKTVHSPPAGRGHINPGAGNIPLVMDPVPSRMDRYIKKGSRLMHYVNNQHGWVACAQEFYDNEAKPMWGTRKVEVAETIEVLIARSEFVQSAAETLFQTIGEARGNAVPSEYQSLVTLLAGRSFNGVRKNLEEWWKANQGKEWWIRKPGAQPR